MPAYVITKAIWDAVQKTAVANNQVSGLLSDANYVVVDCDAGSEFRTLPIEVVPTITITKAPSGAGLDGLMAGMTAAEAITAWTGRPLATVSNGTDPQYFHAVLIDGNRVTDLTATANLTIGTTVSAAGAQDVVVVTQALSVADKVVDPITPPDPVTPPDPIVPTDPVNPPDPAETVVPNVGPYTLAQVEALRTDGTTRGVTIGRTLKKVGVNTLPVGMTRSGTRITVASGADIALVENWDFTGHDFVIKGRVRLFSNCKFGFPTDLQLCLIDMYAGSRIDAFKRCSFLGAGYYGSYTKQSCIRPRIGNPILTSPIIDLMERCEFFGWGGDVIKCVRGGVIRLCYFDTAINLPAGIAKWSSTKAYRIGDWALSADGKYAYSAVTAGTNLALPTAKNSNANWQNQDPHSDTINPYFQFDPSLKIEACYINRLEATRAIDPGKPRVVGINNGIRATRDSGTDPLNKIEVINTIISKSELNESYPIQLQRQDQVNVQPAILHDSWIGTQSGGQSIHPTGRDGHTITNLQDYANPTGSSANCGETGTPATGSAGGAVLDLMPAPVPKPTPESMPASPVIDLTKPAIVFSMGQSEPARVTSTGAYGHTETRTHAPDLDAENFHMFHYNEKFTPTANIISTKATQANRKKMSNAMIALANALNYAVPGKQFVLAVAHEAGSSRTSLSSDSGYPSTTSNRYWGPTQQIVDAVYASYPQGFTRATEYWWAADGASKPNWLRDFSPFYFKQTESGSAVAFGSTPTTLRKQTLDHSVYDFNSSDPMAKGQGLLPRTVPLDVTKSGPNDDDTRADFTGIQKFVDDPRYKSLGGVYGHFGKGWVTNDGAHPHPDHFYGHREAAFEFFMPTLLRAAGIPIDVPKFVGVFTAEDGSYAEVMFHRPNGGILSTPYMVRKDEPMPISLWYQEIPGFEIERASGGGKYWIVRVGSTGIDPKYHGTVTRLNDGKVKIVMVQPLQPGDKITYMWGSAFHRKDTGYPSGGLYGRGDGTGAQAWRQWPIEHVAAYTDPNSEFPFAGFHAENFSPEWVVVRGGYVGTSIPAIEKPVTTSPDLGGKTTDIYWTAGNNGPTFKSASPVPTGTQRIRHVTEMYIPSGLGYINQFGTLHGTAAQAVEIILKFSSTGVPRREIKIARNSANGNITPSSRLLADLPTDIWITCEDITDWTARTITSKTTGLPDIVRTMGAGGNGTMLAGREGYFNGTNLSAGVPAGVRIKSHNLYIGDSTTPFLSISGTAAKVNASPHKVANSGIAT